MAKTAAARYAQLETNREPYLQRARDAAKLTIPSLLPPAGHNGHSKLATPFQGIGARGVNNLASKLLLALLPPNSPFFRLLIDDFTLEALTQQEGMRAHVEEALNQVERTIMTEVEGTAIRVPAFEAFKHLVVAGNVLLYLPPESGMRVFRLDRYVVHRDPMGNVLEHITKESVSPDALPPELQEAVKGKIKTGLNSSNDKTVNLYTWVRRVKNQWVVHQEIEGVIVPGSHGGYPLDKSPWLALRFTRVDGEDYGRGYVEEYYGDLWSLELLTKAIVEGSAAAAKILIFVDPNGTTKLDVVSKSPSGAVRSGNAQDVSILSLDKFADFRVAFQTIENIQQRLAFAFLMNSAIQRGGERVTAEEIRYMAGELEDALGGVYSILSQEFQLPLVNRLIHVLERKKRLPSLPKGVVKPSITTGLEALGRGHDLNKLDALLQRLGPLGPEVLHRYLNVSDYITRAGTSLGIDMKGLVRSEEEVMQQMMQEQMQQMGREALPGAMNIVRDQLRPEAGGVG